MLVHWLSAFLVTQVVEVPIYARSLRHRAHRWQWAFGASVVTHPIVFFIFPRLGIGDYWETVLYAEAFAVGIEAAYLSRLGVSYSVLWAMGANALSVAIGLGLRSLIGWP